MWLTLDFHADRGVVNMLLEMHYDFVSADERNLDRLATLIVPSQACLSDSQAAAISAWVKRGGKLIVLEAGALDQKKSRFVLDVGADYVSPSEYQFDYTVVKAALGANVVSTPFLNYQAGLRTKPTSGHVLAAIREPYFNRTYAHYSSHCEHALQTRRLRLPGRSTERQYHLLRAPRSTGFTTPALFASIASCSRMQSTNWIPRLCSK